MIFHRYLPLEHISEENLPVVLGIMRMLHYRQTHFQKTAGKKKTERKADSFICHSGCSLLLVISLLSRQSSDDMDNPHGTKQKTQKLLHSTKKGKQLSQIH